ncbi:MAG TPA: hypothetical protein VMU28_11825 [Terriglobales bacterium]|nr:hypothetical protein [Terriglobales bacterium]
MSALLWQDDKLDPETVAKMFDRERRAWLETAEFIEGMKSSLISGSVSMEATQCVHNCRARAEALKRIVSRICEQHHLGETKL